MKSEKKRRKCGKKRRQNCQGNRQTVPIRCKTSSDNTK